MTLSRSTSILRRWDHGEHHFDYKVSAQPFYIKLGKLIQQVHQLWYIEKDRVFRTLYLAAAESTIFGLSPDGSYVQIYLTKDEAACYQLIEKTGLTICFRTFEQIFESEEITSTTSNLADLRLIPYTDTESTHATPLFKIISSCGKGLVVSFPDHPGRDQMVVFGKDYEAGPDHIYPLLLSHPEELHPLKAAYQPLEITYAAGAITIPDITPPVFQLRPDGQFWLESATPITGLVVAAAKPGLLGTGLPPTFYVNGFAPIWDMTPGLLTTDQRQRCHAYVNKHFKLMVGIKQG